MRRFRLLGALLLGALWAAGAWADSNVVISPDKTGAPISKYLYGQFIEHLGRGVYGGLWAEMLEDRKFYFVVRDRYAPWGTTEDSNWNSGPFDYLRGSPWRVLGPAGTVTMDVGQPFVGDHSPVVHLPADGSEVGIAQEDLSVEKGRRYLGRLVWTGDPGTEVRVRLSAGGQAVEVSLGAAPSQYKSVPFELVADFDSNRARLEIVGRGAGSFEVGAVSLMPDDAVHGWRADVLELLRQLDSPIYRWPGGNFVSGYDWRDGLGDRDSRPPRQNPAWRGVESNDVGLHEFMDLMTLVGSEPYVCLNTGLGSVEEAAREVEYCVGSADTPMGRLRAANGHPAAFPVHWWAVGNEMFGPWQLGFMPVEAYSKKHNEVVTAIRAIDPSAGVVGVGAVGPWDLAMLSSSAPFMDLISEHIYRKGLGDVLRHTAQLADDIDRVAGAHRSYRDSVPALAGQNLRIAMDEWNFWYGPYLYGELGVQYHLRDALGVARGLHAFFRNSDLYFMANYAQTVNVLGAIKATKTRAALDTTGLVLALYRHRFGSVPVAVRGAPLDLDVSAALTDDSKALTVAAVNPTAASRTVTLQVDTRGFGTKATAWVLSGQSPDSTNEPGKNPQVTVTENPLTAVPGPLEIPAFSVVIVRLE